MTSNKGGAAEPVQVCSSSVNSSSRSRKTISTATFFAVAASQQVAPKPASAPTARPQLETAAISASPWLQSAFQPPTLKATDARSTSKHAITGSAALLADQPKFAAQAQPLSWLWPWQKSCSSSSAVNSSSSSQATAAALASSSTPVPPPDLLTEVGLRQRYCSAACFKYDDVQVRVEAVGGCLGLATWRRQPALIARCLACELVVCRAGSL